MMEIPGKACAVLLGAILLSGCNQASEASTANTQAFASTQTAQQVAEQLAQAVSGPWDLAADQDGTALYVSPSSYHLLGSNRVAVAEKVTGKASAPDSTTIDITEYDCENHSQTLVATFGLDADGKVVGSHSRMLRTSDAKVTTLSPGMVGWSTLQAFCKTLNMNP